MKVQPNSDLRQSSDMCTLYKEYGSEHPQLDSVEEVSLWRHEFQSFYVVFLQFCYDANANQGISFVSG